MPFPLQYEYVKATERALGVRFPLSFVALMLRENGGLVETSPDAWLLYPFRDDSSRRRLKRTCNDIVHQTTWARGRPDFPTDAVAIGSNGGGDEVVLIPTEDDPARLDDAVFWWDHETGDLLRVADDFSDLRVTGRRHR